MRAPVLTIFGAIFVASLGAAVSAYAGDATILGTGIGAAVGGFVGNQFGHGAGRVAATAAGVVGGGLVGNDIGHEMDAENKSPAAAPNNGSAVYDDQAPIAYNAYAPNYVAPPAPPPIYADPQAGTYCREYSQEIDVGGQTQEAYGTACLQPDGSWRIVQ
ncbi:MAG: glycine zipper 2TM domain-containing protein [Alphaproteobacteria bacterium]|nr:glycine zipper 2TM domain-containing protein [Alphaproteobacteria bacterium]